MSWDFLFKCDMYRVEIIILLLFSLCSCQQGEKGEEIGLFHKQIDLEENLILGAPVDMKCVDDNLIIIDANSDAFFHWIKLPDFKYMGKYGELGQGPGEWLKANTLHVFQDTLYCYDSYKSELLQIIPDDDAGKLTFRSCHRFGKDLTIDLFPLSQSRLCAYGCFEHGMLHVTDTAGMLLRVTRDFPARDRTESMLSNQLRFMAYQGCMDTDGKGNVAYLMADSKQCYVYSLVEDSLAEIFSDQSSYPFYKPEGNEGFSVSFKPENKFGYQDITADESGFYGLYSGKSFQDYQQKAFESSLVEAYTWKGALKALYRFDIPVLCFCIDKKRDVFYAITNNPDPVLVCFPLL